VPARLVVPIKKHRLDRETTEIRHGAHRFKGFPLPLWLSRQVAVTEGKILRSQHTYSDFKLFNAGIRQTPKGIVQPAVVDG
jgi:hypothetical protein